jgi:hypothetical protein
VGPAARPLRSLPQDIAATFVRILAYMGILAVLAIAGLSFFGTSDETKAVLAAAPRPEWITVERPHPAFELSWPELTGVPFDYAIMRRPGDGARKDTMTWGDAGAEDPFAVVEIFRAGSGGANFIDAPSELAAGITGFFVTDDVKRAGEIDTKFGPFPMVDFAIALNGNEHRCLGFARTFASPPMQIAGWYCSAHTEVVERSVLGCALDRLMILTAGGDRALDWMFAKAELKRTFCGARSPLLAATPEHEGSFIAAPAGSKLSSVKLRGRLSER